MLYNIMDIAIIIIYTFLIIVIIISGIFNIVFFQNYLIR